MSPLRLIVIAILLYIGYRLLFGGRKKVNRGQAPKEPNGEFPTSDVLEEDPVCHTLVPRQQAVSWQDGDEVFYFCSQECCNTYIYQKGEQG
ncbi:TRASH domain protein [Desulfopila sp. IMCC35008]|uniref:TRASH domain protein n=1 Tax=Desulfopila sp. IMCC35008 TaxID=2653858 RepID=UPI0013D7D07E|nr:TRASH domain protein [Desulfopila sp. IMCC35008]